MNSKQFLESTTSGSVATVATPVGKTQTRGKGIYPNEKGGNLLTGKKTNKKYANSVNESTHKHSNMDQWLDHAERSGYKVVKGQGGWDAHAVDKNNQEMGTFSVDWGSQAHGKGYLKSKQPKTLDEAKLDEEDVIIVPGQGNRIKPGFIPRKADRTDHEVEMALSDLFQSAKNAKQVYELIKDIPETVGIEGWVQEKIIKANDYLNTVREYLEHKQMSEMTVGVIAGGGVGEGVAEASDISGLMTAASMVKDYIVTAEVDGVVKKFRIRGATGPRSAKERFLKHHSMAKILDVNPEQGVAEGYRILPNIDREKYQEREGLEGPFRARNGKVYYYDPKAGMAYDPDTDFYIDYDELKMMDREMSEGIGKDIAKLGGAAALALGLGAGGAYLDKAQPKVEIGGQKAYLIQNPNWGMIPKQAMTVQGEDGKMYVLWSKKAAGGPNWYATPAENVNEGIVGKVLGGAALLASLWGIGQQQAQQVYSNSPQLQTLIKYHQMATQQGDQAKIQELERRIENQKTRLSLGKGEVMGSDNKPIVPSFESSIMKGIQNEAKKIPDKCPECGGKLVAESELNEEGNKDACYHKVKSRYKVWPSAYASGALVKCRKVGASNWGDKKK